VLQLLSLDLHSVRDVHQLCFHAFIVTCFAAAVAGSAQRARRAGTIYGKDYSKRE
jgi:hypothetical protein